MRGLGIRALCVAGVFAVGANAAPAQSAVQPASALDLTSYSTIVDPSAMSRERLAGQFDLALPVDLPPLSYGPPGSMQPGVSGLFGRLSLSDNIAVEFGVNTDLSAHFAPSNAAVPSAYDGLFFGASAADQPFAAVAGGSYLGASIALSPELGLSLGGASLAAGTHAYQGNAAATIARLGGAPDPFDTRSAQSLLAGVSWDVAPWAGIGLVASQTTERNGLIGNFSGEIRSADSTAMGMTARVQLGGGWMTTASFAEAVTKLDMKPGIGATTDDLRTHSYGLAVAKRGVFGNDALGVAVTRPASDGFGGSEFTLVSALDARPQYFAGRNLLENRAPETDFEVGYVTTFLDGSLALQTNASYQMNFAGQTGANAVSLLSRAKIKF